MNEKQITKFIKDNTMLGDCLSQKMTLYELKTLLIKYENEQLQLLGVSRSLPTDTRPTFDAWCGFNSVIQHADGTYLYKDRDYSAKQLETIYRQKTYVKR